MKEKIDVAAYAEQIVRAMPKGILLNTNGEKLNTMVIGWGALGTVWARPAFTVYVRESRYTKAQLDRTGEFTISVPLGAPDLHVTQFCGHASGRDYDKFGEAGLTPEPPEVIGTPGVREYPLTLECRVLYTQPQEPALLPPDILEQSYPQTVPDPDPMAGRDMHTMYIGEIVSAYIIR